MTEGVAFSRCFRISFGTPTFHKEAYIIEGEINPPLLPTKSKVIDAVTIPSNAIKLSNLEEDGNSLRGFKWELNTTRKPSTDPKREEDSILTMFNLDDESVEVLSQEGAVVRIEAGYGQTVKLIYSGDVENVTPSRQGADMAYKVMCKDGLLDTKNTRVSISYPPSVPASDVILDLANKFPSASVSVDVLYKLKDVRSFGGWQYQGELESVFNRVLYKHQLEYSRYNGKITVKPKVIVQGDSVYKTLSTNNYVLNDDNMEVLVPILNNGQKKSAQKDTKRGVQVSCRLLNDVTMDQFFTIKSNLFPKYNGTYKIVQITHNCSFPTGDWNTVLSGEPL